MAIIAIEVSDSEKEWLQYMAEFYGQSLSEFNEAIFYGTVGRRL